VRRGSRALVCLILSLVIAGLTAGFASSPADAATSAAPADDRAWSATDAAEQLQDDNIVVLPGSIARFDEARVRGYLAGTPYKVLVVPPSPLDSAQNTEYVDRLIEVEDLLQDAYYADLDPAVESDRPELITVKGLDVRMVGPDDLTTLRRYLETYDLTTSLEFAIRYQVDGVQLDNEPPAIDPVSDPAVVSDLVARLRTERVVVDDAVDYRPSDGMLTAFEETTGNTARVVVLPPRAIDEVPDVTATDLAAAIPGDVVVLIRGRWFEVAGPGAPGSPGTAEFAYARMMVLSKYQDFLLGRDIGPGNIMRVLGDYYAELTSGVVTDQELPQQRNPLRWLLLALPVLAAALVVGFALRYNRRRGRTAATVRHRSAADLGAAAAALPDLAAGILAVDGLAQEGRPAELVDRAVERYRAALDLVRDAQQPGPAWEAIEQSRAALQEAAELLGVPQVPGLAGATA